MDWNHFISRVPVARRRNANYRSEHNRRRLVEWVRGGATHARPPKTDEEAKRKAHKFSHHPEKFTRVHLLSFLTSTYYVAGLGVGGGCHGKLMLFVCTSEELNGERKFIKEEAKDFPRHQRLIPSQPTVDVFSSERAFFAFSVCLLHIKCLPDETSRFCAILDERASCFSQNIR